MCGAAIIDVLRLQLQAPIQEMLVKQRAAWGVSRSVAGFLD